MASEQTAGISIAAVRLGAIVLVHSWLQFGSGLPASAHATRVPPPLPCPTLTAACWPAPPPTWRSTTWLSCWLCTCSPLCTPVTHPPAPAAACWPVLPPTWRSTTWLSGWRRRMARCGWCGWGTPPACCPRCAAAAACCLVLLYSLTTCGQVQAYPYMQCRRCCCTTDTSHHCIWYDSSC